jgi:hypothetical protein
MNFWNVFLNIQNFLNFFYSKFLLVTYLFPTSQTFRLCKQMSSFGEILKYPDSFKNFKVKFSEIFIFCTGSILIYFLHFLEISELLTFFKRHSFAWLGLHETTVDVPLHTAHTCAFGQC